MALPIPFLKSLVFRLGQATGMIPGPVARPKTFIAMVCYGTGRQSYPLQVLHSLHEAFRDGAIREFLAIDNALGPEVREQLGPDTTLIGGDNSIREFSGFNRLFDFLGPRLDEFEVVHLVTDTFLNDYQHYLGLFTPLMMALVVEKNIALGHLDAYPKRITLLGERSQSWLRTCYMFLPARTVRSLGTFVTIDPRMGLFTDDPNHPFMQDAPIDALYREYLIQWLTGKASQRALIDVHRDRFLLSSETFERFKSKVGAILNEHGLSIRLRKANVPTVDVEWLYDALLRHRVDWINVRTDPMAMIRQTSWNRRFLGIVNP